VACQWRIRHKLILGLGLVVGIIALLLAGTVKGLLSLGNNSKSVSCKIEEEQKAEELCEAIGRLTHEMPSQGQLLHLERHLGDVHHKLALYQEQLQGTLVRRRDRDRGFEECQIVEALITQLQQLEAELQKEPPPIAEEGTSTDLLNQVRKRLDLLALTADDLIRVIYGKIRELIKDSSQVSRTSLIIVLTTSISGVLLLAGLLRFFYGWVFYPIRDLEAGAERVAEGDFDHRIVVHSGDEMEDLAAAFNNMTGRLREMYRDLAHQVNERSRQLVRSERLASVGFLAAGVAHEINNPLASIAFCSEALESRLADILAKAPGDGETITKYLKMIQQEAFRCKAITQRLLEFSRGGERRREPTDLAELIQSVLDVVQHLQNYKGKQVILESPGSLTAWVNSQEIKSVVLNLVVNALDSMGEEGKLTITLRQRDRMAEMVFTDTGCGMTPEILENIFEPFFTRSRTGKGTGLGLSISHRVITQHGGEIEASSLGLNQGSTFTVRLPLQPAEGSGVRSQEPGVRSQELDNGEQTPRRYTRRAA
jgi:signal transduction histidine kinase